MTSKIINQIIKDQAIEEISRILIEDKQLNPDWYTIKMLVNSNPYYNTNFLEYLKLQTVDEFVENIVEEFTCFDDSDMTIAQMKHILEYTIPDDLLRDATLDSNMDELAEDLTTFIETEINTEEVLNQKIELNLFPYQDENLHREGSELAHALRDLEENINGEDENEITNECLLKLFKSQGFDPNNTKDIDKEDPFIKSFLEEIEEMILEYNNCAFLTFLVSMSIKDFFDFKNQKAKIVFEDGKVGLYDATNGGGSIFNIKLNKPFVIETNKKDHFKPYQIEYLDSYGYNVGDVYGFSGKDYKSKIKIIKGE